MLQLLTTNAKLSKRGQGLAAEFAPVLLTMAPHSIGGGPTVCRDSSAGCRAACEAHFAGMMRMRDSRQAALDRKRLFFEAPALFHDMLDRAIKGHAERATRKGRRPLYRLNGASDLDWSAVIERHSGMQFYDYTKVRSRFERYLAGELPSNYALTFSADERTHTATICRYLRQGGNVAIVFDVPYHPGAGIVGDLPREWAKYGERWPVIDGDAHDVRLPAIDGRGVVVGLRGKGDNAAKDRGRRAGFIRSLAGAFEAKAEGK